MGKYHVVCHDCEEEAMLTDGERASERTADHESTTGHRVSCKQVA